MNVVHKYIIYLYKVMKVYKVTQNGHLKIKFFKTVLNFFE